MFMPTARMPFYARAYMIYLMSEASERDADASNAFFGVVEIWAEEIRADASLLDEVVACLGHVAGRQEWYRANVSIYGDFKEHAARALRKLGR